MQAQLRKMNITDTSAVAAIEAMISAAPWSERLFADCVEVGYECWVLDNDSQIIGFGILSFGADEAHVLNIAILPQFQGQGCGKQMMRHLIAVAASLGAKEVFLEVRISNTRARSLYQNLNFAEIGLRKGYYPAEGELAAEDAITLALALS